MISTNPQPKELGQLDVDFRDVNLPAILEPETELYPISSGFNSAAYRVTVNGDFVLKVGKAYGTEDEITSLKKTMEEEHMLIEDFVGYAIPDTYYAIAPGKTRPDTNRVLQLQEYVDGQPLHDAIEDNTADLTEIVSFFEDALRMYRITYKIPDLANIQERFRPVTNSNVLVTSNGSESRPSPNLTDTHFGKIQRSKILGPIWSMAIALGVKSFIEHIDA
jgi:hypothetical protein